MALEANDRCRLLLVTLALLGAAVGGGLAYLAEASKQEVGVACAQAVSRGCTSTVTDVTVSVAVVLVGAVLGAVTVTAAGLLVRALMNANH